MPEVVTHLPFENKARIPPIWVAIVVAVAVVAAVQEIISPVPDPAVSGWWILAGYVVFVVVSDPGPLPVLLGTGAGGRTRAERA
ncbi:MAG: hypothetical protein M3471_03045 [Actinomycetota bacterium]|nr:hypothetical protein [Actinomycetota bacterium]